MREGEEKGEGGVGSEKRGVIELPPTPLAVYIGTFYYSEYLASGPEYPDSPEYPGPEPETPAPPETAQKDVQKTLI